MKLFKLLILSLILCSVSVASPTKQIIEEEKTYDLRCVREAIVEIESKLTGKKEQVEKQPKVTIGTRILSPTRTFTDADVFIGGKKEYRFAVNKLVTEIETTSTSKKIHYDCEATRFENDGSTRNFCGPWVEVFEVDSFGTETFKGYEVNGVLDLSTEVRFQSELPDGTILDSLVNTQMRVTLETETEIWRIYREHQSCILEPRK